VYVKKSIRAWSTMVTRIRKRCCAKSMVSRKSDPLQGTQQDSDRDETDPLMAMSKNMCLARVNAKQIE